MDDAEDPGGCVMQGQMYVEQLTPLDGVTHPLPLLFIHGRGQTGVVSLHRSPRHCRDLSAECRNLLSSLNVWQNWLNTPDGRKGWASFFVDCGYKVFLIDGPTRGRSSWQSSSKSYTTISVEFVESHCGSCSHHRILFTLRTCTKLYLLSTMNECLQRK